MDKPTPITALLSQENSATQQTLKRCRSLRRLEQLVASLLPPELRHHCRLGNIRDVSAVIYCDSAAWVSRLRYQVPQLLSQLQQHPHLTTIKQIELKVMPLQYQRAPKRDKSVLSQDAAACLSACADMVSDKPLRDALTRLAKHHKKG